MATTFKTLYEYAQRRLGNRTDSNAVAVAKECVNNAIRYLSEKDLSFYRKRGLINVLASFTSGTVSVDPDSTYVSLSSGGSWLSTYSSGMIVIGDKRVAYGGSITSDPARFTFGNSATWGYASQANVTYRLFKYAYDLPSDYRIIGDILDETILGKLEWLDDINEFETYRLQTYGTSGQFEVACIEGRKLMLWPPVTAKQVIPLPYFRTTTDMSSDTDNMDYPDTGGHLLLVRRTIDWFAAIEEGDDKKTDKAHDRMQEQAARTRLSSHRNRGGNIVLGSAGARPIRVTKIVGDDD